MLAGINTKGLELERGARIMHGDERARDTLALSAIFGIDPDTVPDVSNGSINIVSLSPTT